MYTKRPNFNNFGRFFVSKNKKIRVHTKRKKPGDEPGFNIVPRAMQGAWKSHSTLTPLAKQDLLLLAII